MHFANPEYLVLLIFIPIYLGWKWYRRKNREAIQISVFEDLKKAQGWSFWRYSSFLKSVLIVVYIALVTVAIARPQGEHEKQKISKEGIDVIVALDVSESMLAEDLKPNRIEAAKEQIKKFVSGLKTDRAGIIVFAGQAFTQSPLSFDYNILTEYLDQISTDSVNQRVRGLGGTAIGDAILAAINRFRDSEDRSKVLILLTDGDANTGADPKIAAAMARKKGIKLYTIGIGKEGGAPLPISNMFGQKQYARNRDGSIMMATFNEAALKKVAEIGNGRYFRASDDNSFARIFEDIARMEQKDIEIETVVEYTENFMPFLYAAFGAMVMYLVLVGAKPLKS